MPVPTFNKLGPYPKFEDLVVKINTLVAELQNLLVSLDTLNIIKLNARIIEAGSITADKITVSELSALSANLGHITAGLIESITMRASEIYGSYIATSQGTYPRAEMSSSDDAFAVYWNLLNNIKIIADFIGSPQMQFNAGTVRGSLFAITSPSGPGGTFSVLAQGGDLQLSGNNVRLSPNGGANIVPSWSSMFSNSNAQTLQQALDSKGSQSTQDYLVSMVNFLDARVTALENA